MRASWAAGQSRLYVPWIGFAAVCTLLMCLLPGEETVPYHLAWIGLALAYGIEAWPWARTVYAVIVFTICTGAVIVVRASTQVIGWGETAEIPLMSILVLLVLWNVRKRQVAYGELSRLAEQERARAVQREQLNRMTSHEMRTPATIALGYVDMLLKNETDERVRSDLRVIGDELSRLVLVADRVMRMIRVHDHVAFQRQDLAALVRETGERWSVVAERNWVVTCEPIELDCSAERLRACLDTLVENALRYTEDGDTVRIFGRRAGGAVTIGVADSGPGMDPQQVQAVNRGRLAASAQDPDLAQTQDQDYVAEDPKAQTGLGLALVRETARARGGRVVAGVSAEGGAVVMMVLPLGVRGPAPQHGGVDTAIRPGPPYAEPGPPPGHGAPIGSGRTSTVRGARRRARKSVTSA
ncbi:sensor histidine kinase [Nocardioides pocheonensis]|uniref:histidine kinase n=1 Tax=Nocardioides pocheonensis TaxID=661485 RepID=A0A3N0GTN2_9ACTN|nr:HAMP domain-containing sensor histidine kinase [Nocardioides pocheonensis]RNM15779.1 sensor histidine kinase [Nocardioides pocheonensis]